MSEHHSNGDRTDKVCDVWARLIDPASFSPEAARAILQLKFGRDDQQRMHALAQKAQQGTLTAEEDSELAAYRHVGAMVSVLWSRARQCLSNERDND